jgi:acyl-CoA thioester hydrolase
VSPGGWPDQPRERDHYRVFTPQTTRWMDNDQFGHLNNVVHYSLFDTAVNATLIRELGFDPNADATVFFVVSTSATFHASLAWPASVEVGARLARLGSSSLTYELAVFAQGAPLAASTGQFVHVHVDRATQRPVPLRAPQRSALVRAYGTVG